MARQRIRGVSVDALGTIVTVRGGSVGQQYAALTRRFLKERSPSPSSSSGAVHHAALDPSVMEQSFRVAYKQHLTHAIGPTRPRTQEADRMFWTGRVLPDVLRPALGTGGGEFTSAQQAELFNAIYDHFGSHLAWELLPGAADALGNMMQRGLQIACVTNNDRRMSQVLAELGTTAVPPGTPQAEALLKISSFLVCAFDVKQLKPDAEGIRAVMSRAGVLPEHWLHVGDEDADEAAAKGAGCHFVRVSPASGLHWQDVSQFVD